MARPIEKREHIEAAVVQVVAKKGLSATTIQDLADAAGVSPGLLYRYWQGRDELAAHVYRTHYSRLIERFAARLSTAQQSPATAQFWPVLRALLAEFLAFADAEPVVLRFLMLSQHELAPHVPAEHGLRALLSHLIDIGQQQGAIRPLPRELALQFLLGVGMQPVIGVFYEDLAAPASNYLDEIFDALRRVLASERALTEEETW